jgi:regulator of replication initiation timing
MTDEILKLYRERVDMESRIKELEEKNVHLTDENESLNNRYDNVSKRCEDLEVLIESDACAKCHLALLSLGGLAREFSQDFLEF